MTDQPRKDAFMIAFEAFEAAQAERDEWKAKAESADARANAADRRADAAEEAMTLAEDGAFQMVGEQYAEQIKALTDRAEAAERERDEWKAKATEAVPFADAMRAAIGMLEHYGRAPAPLMDKLNAGFAEFRAKADAIFGKPEQTPAPAPVDHGDHVVATVLQNDRLARVQAWCGDDREPPTLIMLERKPHSPHFDDNGGDGKETVFEVSIEDAATVLDAETARLLLASRKADGETLFVRKIKLAAEPMPTPAPEPIAEETPMRRRRGGRPATSAPVKVFVDGVEHDQATGTPVEPAPVKRELPEPVYNETRESVRDGDDYPSDLPFYQPAQIEPASIGWTVWNGRVERVPALTAILAEFTGRYYIEGYRVEKVGDRPVAPGCLSIGHVVVENIDDAKALNGFLGGFAIRHFGTEGVSLAVPAEPEPEPEPEPAPAPAPKVEALAPAKPKIVAVPSLHDMAAAIEKITGKRPDFAPAPAEPAPEPELETTFADDEDTEMGIRARVSIGASIEWPLQSWEISERDPAIITEYTMRNGVMQRDEHHDRNGSTVPPMIVAMLSAIDAKHGDDGGKEVRFTRDVGAILLALTGEFQSVKRLYYRAQQWGFEWKEQTVRNRMLEIMGVESLSRHIDQRLPLAWRVWSAEPIDGGKVEADDEAPVAPEPAPAPAEAFAFIRGNNGKEEALRRDRLLLKSLGDDLIGKNFREWAQAWEGMGGQLCQQFELERHRFRLARLGYIVKVKGVRGHGTAPRYRVPALPGKLDQVIAGFGQKGAEA